MSKQSHHGGSWKIAYADFVTSMMALFLVLWLTSQDTRIKEAIERSFRNPYSSATKESVGILPNKDVQALEKQKGNFDSPSALNLELLRRITQDLAQLLQQDAEGQNSVKLDMTSEGLLINVFDRTQKPIFEPKGAQFTQYGAWVFSTLAWEIGRYPTFTVELEGHTESGGGTDPRRLRKLGTFHGPRQCRPPQAVTARDRSGPDLQSVRLGRYEAIGQSAPGRRRQPPRIHAGQDPAGQPGR
jgi:hypothetical protein